jgi:hypothetical protein
VITDIKAGEDRFVLDASDFGIEGPLVYAEGVTADLGGGANVIVQLDAFPNAGAAARAIADNPDITADAGFFIYHNTTLGINRLVHSEDLSDGGRITIVANLTDAAGSEAIAQQAAFSAADFLLADERSPEAAAAPPATHSKQLITTRHAVRTSRRLIALCRRRGSAPCLPIVRTGFSEDIGSWKIMAIRLPRSARKPALLRLASSTPSRRVRPPAPGRRRPTTAAAAAP